MTAKETRATIVPALRYHDATHAVAWLGEAFGFEERNVFRDGEGRVTHAELSFGNGMIMLGPVTDTEFGRLMRQPDTGGVTMTVYAIVDDPDAHFARAKAAGAAIVRDLRDEDYGGRGYSCLDFEGHVWTFGSYDPWAAG